MKHFGDPCIHCGTAHDNVPVGPCQGDPEKVRPISYRGDGVRKIDHVERFIVMFSDGSIIERYAHISEHAPYYHFGYSDDLTQPPRYDADLQLPA